MSSTSANKKIFDVALLRRVFGLAIPYKKKVIWSLVLAILLALLTPIRPWLIQLTVNNYIRNGLLDWVIRITLIQFGLLLVETVFRFLFTFTTSWLGQSVVKNLRVRVFNKIVGLNLSQFDTTPIGTLTTRTINDIESVNEVFSDGLIPIIADFLSIISILFVMFWVDWKLALISLAPFPLLILATYIFKESVNRSFIRVRNAVAALNAFVQEHLTGIQVVQTFAAEEREADKFKKINREHRNANINAIFAYSVFFPVVEIILAVSTGLLVWWAASNALELPPEQAAEMAGKMISFVLFLNLLFRPLRVIADKFNVLQMGMVASERVFKVIDNQDYIKTEGRFAPEKIQGKIEFEQVWFAYKEEQYVLRNLNFTVQPGETVALVGHTGSGKTSIISLLNRLYHINKGQIRIDGVPVEEYTLGALRRQIGVVLQDVFLFSGSVLDNITLRNPAISREQVVHAARLIGVHDFIETLPGGYDYNVMERGATLSLGQRQILSFIRALLYDPGILILDEATSSVDTESEQLIQQAIDTLISGRTAIVIAHRLSTIRKADKIIVLDKGEVKEIGTHEELLEKKGYYSGLVESQFGEKGKGERGNGEGG
ncbi:ABC transporter ATP-binding protein [Flavihumibacter sp. CACIAM 22H1]|uniref:ABC transporter ATP-binding protein n=1 Tax=Flavihumibacter sp. CACIAM 22H1 TaxID=1812911 RepID=UPI0007A801FF|nr:ABC transporter ATP-binding protein [Flavihumibacter sp. CACIAM 22H1]KYP14188.1 MAG: antibiotic ABC transporter ATP-binding protein [Flavihumibacter sp. CACIAM 22H1]